MIVCVILVSCSVVAMRGYLHVGCKQKKSIVIFETFVRTKIFGITGKIDSRRILVRNPRIGAEVNNSAEGKVSK